MRETRITEGHDRLPFNRIRSERLFEEVLRQVERWIIDGELKSGDMLPPERMMTEQFGVSRTVIREATKALELRGLVEVQHGRGVMVVRPSPASISDSVIRFLKIQQSPIWALHELRSILEVEIAALAAERRTEKDVRRLEEMLDQMAASVDAPQQYIKFDLEFHRVLAQAAQNPLFQLVLEPFVTLLMETRRLGSSAPSAPRRSIKAHRRIVAAVKNQDLEEAQLAMREHFANLATFIREAESQKTKAVDLQSRGAD